MMSRRGRTTTASRAKAGFKRGQAAEAGRRPPWRVVARLRRASSCSRPQPALAGHIGGERPLSQPALAAVTASRAFGAHGRLRPARGERPLFLARAVAGPCRLKPAQAGLRLTRRSKTVEAGPLTNDLLTSGANVPLCRGRP